MPKTQVSLDVTRIENFVFDMSRCVKCKGCTWVDHIYMPGVRYSTRCPSATRYLFDSYGAYGKMRIGLGLVEGRLDYSDGLLKILYACTLCGACDVGCKRNLDLEIELTLEALRVKAVRDGKGPMPAHRKAARSIIEKHNSLGAVHKNRRGWITDALKPSPKADVLYFVGCAASYTHPEIARATAKILAASGTPFMLLPDEWCCGNMLYSVGMMDEARELAQRNVDAVRQAGAKTLLVSCAEGYRMWKVDYPKMLGISTDDLGFGVVHLVEHVAESVKQGALKLTNRMDLRLTYHDPCSLSRLSEPWVPWKGERGLWGVVVPPLERRRGTHGVYEAPRDVLRLIPGVELVEMPRMRENAFCCGAGRGTKEAFPEFAAWAADERLTEVGEVGADALVSACPWCKDNFGQSVSRKQGNLKVLDFSELVLSAIGPEG
jgi:heterodisulfide reductase subunit D